MRSIASGYDLRPKPCRRPAPLPVSIWGRTLSPVFRSGDRFRIAPERSRVCQSTLGRTPRREEAARVFSSPCYIPLSAVRVKHLEQLEWLRTFHDPKPSPLVGAIPVVARTEGRHWVCPTLTIR